VSVRDITTTLELKSVIVMAAVAVVATAGAGSAALGVGPIGGQEAVAAQQENSLETAVTLNPSNATVMNGETTTYDVVVESTDGGVGAYDFTVTVDNPAVASVTDIELFGNPSDQTKDVTIAEDGSTASAVAALANTSDTGQVTIATVTVTGDAAGETDLSLAVDALGTEAGNSYVVTEANGGTLTVTGDDPDSTPEPTATPAPTPTPEPANFEVSDLSAPTSATQGDTVDVTATIENTGDEEATKTVEFVFDGNVDDSTDVTLAGGASQQVNFSVDTAAVPLGTYTHGVSAGDDSATAQITIESPEDDSDGDGSDGDDSDSDDGDDSDSDDGDDGDETLPETAVSLQPADSTVIAGETTTYNLVVDSADGGVGAYDFTVSIADPSIASISDVAVGGNPSAQTTDVSIADDGSSADVTAALANTSDSGSVTIATITVRGDEAGTSDVGLAVEALGTEAGESYTVTETTGASITVESDDQTSEPDPANFQVSNLTAPSSATQGDAINVSADVTNDGDEEATQTVEFRLDVDGDGALDGNESLTSQEVTLDGDETQTVTFSDLNTSGLDAGDYTHGVFTDDDSATATITIEAIDDGDDADDGDGADDGDDADDGEDADDGDDGDDGGEADDGDSADKEFTLDEIAQAKYGYDFANLSTETAGEVQAIYNRQPFPDGTKPDDIRTRDEITNDRYGYDFDEVSRETTVEVQNDYDAQFEEDN